MHSGLNWSAVLSNLRWAAYFITCLSALNVILSLGTHFAKEWMYSHGDATVSKLTWRYSLLLKVLSSFPTVSRWTLSTVLFCSGVIVGYIYHDIQQYNQIHHEVIHVLSEDGERRYTVQVQGARQPSRFEVCPLPSPDPGFDVGDWLEVWFVEEVKARGGICNSFLDADYTGWHLTKQEEASR